MASSGSSLRVGSVPFDQEGFVRQIVVERGSFIYRWFRWSLEVVETWNPSETRPNSRYLEGTNLCHMMRVILLLAPVALLTELAMIAFVVFAFVVYPVKMLGSGTWAIGAVCRLIIVGVVALCVAFARNSHVVESDTPKPATITDLVIQSLIAQKQKICPLVKFSGRTQS